MGFKYCTICQKDTEWDETPVCTVCGCFFKPEDDNARFTEAIEYNDTKQIGTSVSGPERTRVRRMKKGGSGGSAVETTWDAFERGKKTILSLATALTLPLGIITSANNTYRLGLCLKFTSGRSMEIVASACLYIACRLNNHPVLLTDLIEVMAAPCSPASLSKVCVRLSRALSISLPPVLGGTDEKSCGLDPSVFLFRFASKLELGEKTVARAVALTALRVLRRMQQDWIHWGRHPAGLFGAALLIAARLHGFKRTQHEISKVVYIGECTVGKRVTDFANTPSASLSMSEFDNNTAEPCNPPCFEQGRLNWETPDDTIKWPERLPSRPDEIQKWIDAGMGFADSPGDLGENSLLDKVAESYIIRDEKESEKKSKIWDFVNREWVVLKQQRDEEKKAKEQTTKKREKLKSKAKGRTKPVSAAYRLVMEEREAFLRAKREGNIDVNSGGFGLKNQADGGDESLEKVEAEIDSVKELDDFDFDTEMFDFE